ncbi:MULTISPECIES: helix-turn-helix transcriptional regulator [Serratia]|uniref:helix-turn-helix transcriptional regulator n=1 Tax=Serratia TaxID=613 RepID=UPI0013D8F214|nr:MULTISPECIES: PAS domain-containing protein [Serratia]MBH2517407.1 PAS domain-containing protein [Serratia ureilytica]MBH2533359.1 PAS domain-containing protein [Serratia ureilytica]
MTEEREQILKILTASLEALRTTLPLNTEAVLHDLTRPESSVVHIVNGHVSGRKEGDALLSGPEDDTGFLGLLDPSQRVSSRVFSGYTATTMTGTSLSSATTIYYSSNGIPLVAFCINVDVDAVFKLKRDLVYLLHPNIEDEVSHKPFDKLQDKSLDEVLSKFRPTGSESKMDFRMRVISEIHTLGFFKIKGSVNNVAKALGVTRFTVYNYLDKLNDKA